MRTKIEPGDDTHYIWVDIAGYWYDNEEEFANASPNLLPMSSVFWYLMKGKRTPQNDYERNILRQGKEIEARGGIIEMPFD